MYSNKVLYFSTSFGQDHMWCYSFKANMQLFHMVYVVKMVKVNLYMQFKVVKANIYIQFIWLKAVKMVKVNKGNHKTIKENHMEKQLIIKSIT